MTHRDPTCFDIKIADLGYAQKFDKEKGMEMCLGTPLYMAPELVEQKNYSEKVDVWSLGCIVYQLLSGTTPFEASTLGTLNAKILKQKVVFCEIEWANVSKKAKNFIKKCLDKD